MDQPFNEPNLGTRFLVVAEPAPSMRKDALVLGLLFLITSIVLIATVNVLAITYNNLEPLAITALILLVVGTLLTGYSIWDEVMGRTGEPKET